jgi:hypothetical protein
MSDTVVVGLKNPEQAKTRSRFCGRFYSNLRLTIPRPVPTELPAGATVHDAVKGALHVSGVSQI